MIEHDRTKDPVQLRLWYRELHKKQADGTFDSEDVFNWLYVCIELGRLGYITNEDESDWILPPDTPQKSD